MRTSWASAPSEDRAAKPGGFKQVPEAERGAGPEREVGEALAPRGWEAEGSTRGSPLCPWGCKVLPWTGPGAPLPRVGGRAGDPAQAAAGPLGWAPPTGRRGARREEE